MSAAAFEGLINSINNNMQSIIERQKQAHQSLLQRHAMAHHSLMEALSQPKEVMRDADGKITGVK